jgi:hypothetical protein
MGYVGWILFLLTAMGLALCVRRLLQYDTFVKSYDRDMSFLIDYCKHLAKQDLISDAPEVVRFHRIVQTIANRQELKDG